MSAEYFGYTSSERTEETGACCHCGTEELPADNIIFVSMASPEPGLGCWGCRSCNLPIAGAISVVCGACLDLLRTTGQAPKSACIGPPGLNRRIALSALTVPFDHDHSIEKHERVFLASDGTTLDVGNVTLPDLSPFQELVEKIADRLVPEIKKRLNDFEAAKARHSRN